MYNSDYNNALSFTFIWSVDGFNYSGQCKGFVSSVYVVEVNSDGDKGYPENVVVEVGICRIDMETLDYDSVYGELIEKDPLDMGKTSLDFLTDRAGIDTRELYLGLPEENVISDVKKILKGQDVACFDVRETFMKYLLNFPWDMTKEVMIMPAVSFRVPKNLNLKRDDPVQDRIVAAYNSLCPGDPAGIKDGRRALHLAQMTSEILIILRKEGMY